ncbi:NAD(P)H-dependent oxidoreductase [Paracoccus sp. 11-3]|uniref:NAD(P)H-dependent oxidoreductase n=1 Tax=Paracoccus amoyensis TaxID=2760093 RepID=A0A926JDR0_9RHOB|nr:NADPH-dependent FMN reductase [Paracoccus amoyensis]MBC9247959.1 NAD(P)H-dependent oxidoreductase [Paracoccus amoyensis]
MTTILGISGSLRHASFNSGLLRAAQELAPAGVDIVIGSIADVPLYNGDDEATYGQPAAVEVLKRQLAQADGLLLVTPEYNNSVPGVMKNAIDWMSRKDGLELFVGKPVAVTGASPGGFGTVMAQAAWEPILRTLRTQPWWEGRLLVSRAGGLYDAQGNLTDDKTRQAVADFIAGFAASFDG